jgi:hypothetical protein
MKISIPMDIDVPKSAKRPPRAKQPDDADLVSGYKLAAHLGMCRQNVDSLTSQGVLTRRADGLFDQTANRLAYLKPLKLDRRSPVWALADSPMLQASTNRAPSCGIRIVGTRPRRGDHACLADAAADIQARTAR